MGESATKGDALSFAAAKLVWRAVEEMSNAKQLGELIDARGDLGLRLFAKHEGESQLLAHNHRGKQRAILRYVAHATFGGRQSGDLLITQTNAAALDGTQTADSFEDGRLTATAATHQHAVFAGGNREIYTA